MASCGTTKNADIDTNLPKDVSEKPLDENNQKYDRAQLDKLKAEIEGQIAKEKCNNPDDWAYSPIGSKACGGPLTFIAYPKKLHDVILPKIEEYTLKMTEFNKKYNIISDCMMAVEPTSIKCENGQAVLVYGGME